MARRSVYTFPLDVGVSDALNETLAEGLDAEVEYAVYVDVMSPTATPMLVAIVTDWYPDPPEKIEVVEVS